MTAIGFGAFVVAVAGLVAIGTARAQSLPPEVCGLIGKRLESTSPQERVEEFAKLNLEDQYATYICAMQHVHPPIIELSKPFAASGATAAAYLQKKLASAADDETVLNIAQVFVVMGIDRTYDVAGDAALMRLLERRLGGVRAESESRARTLLDFLHGREEAK